MIYLQVYEFGKRNGHIRYELLPFGTYQQPKTTVKPPGRSTPPPQIIETSNCFAALEDIDDDEGEPTNNNNKTRQLRKKTPHDQRYRVTS